MFLFHSVNLPCQGKELLIFGEFCFTMIGRADIEGSKSNVAMNACAATQAGYACRLWGVAIMGREGGSNDALYKSFLIGKIPSLLIFFSLRNIFLSEARGEMFAKFSGKERISFYPFARGNPETVKLAIQLFQQDFQQVSEYLILTKVIVLEIEQWNCFDTQESNINGETRSVV